MRTPVRASSRTKLAEALGYSRQQICAYARLPDSPPARGGYYSVGEWRRFINRKRSVMEVGEKQRLQLELLRAKVAREQDGLAQNRELTRAEIIEGLVSEFDTALRIIRDESERMMMFLANEFEGLKARAIYSLWKKKIDEVYTRIAKRLEEAAGVKVNLENSDPKIIPLKAACG